MYLALLDIVSAYGIDNSALKTRRSFDNGAFAPAQDDKEGRAAATNEARIHPSVIPSLPRNRRLLCRHRRQRLGRAGRQKYGFGSLESLGMTKRRQKFVRRHNTRRSFSYADASFRMTIRSGKCPKRSTYSPVCHSELRRRWGSPKNPLDFLGCWRRGIADY